MEYNEGQPDDRPLYEILAEAWHHMPRSTALGVGMFVTGGTAALITSHVIRTHENLHVLQPTHRDRHPHPNQKFDRVEVVNRIAALVVDYQDEKVQRETLEELSGVPKKVFTQQMSYLKKHNLVKIIRPTDPESETNYYYYAPAKDLLRGVAEPGRYPSLHQALVQVRLEREQAAETDQSL